MASIIREAEAHMDDWGHCASDCEGDNKDDATSITRAARELAHDRDVAGIAVFTQTGHTALLMSKARPNVPILAFTPDAGIYQRMGLYWGVMSFMVPLVTTMESMIDKVEETIIVSSPLEPGQQVIIISGFPVGDYRLPNFALLHTVRSR